MNRSHKYCGANPFKDLNTIVWDSDSASSRMVFQLRPLIIGFIGASKLLFVISLAAR